MTRPMLSLGGRWPFGGDPSVAARTGAALLEAVMVTATVQPKGVLAPLAGRGATREAMAEALAAFVAADDPAGFLRARRGH